MGCGASLGIKNEGLTDHADRSDYANRSESTQGAMRNEPGFLIERPPDATAIVASGPCSF